MVLAYNLSSAHPNFEVRADDKIGYFLGPFLTKVIAMDFGEAAAVGAAILVATVSSRHRTMKIVNYESSYTYILECQAELLGMFANTILTLTTTQST